MNHLPSATSGSRQNLTETLSMLKDFLVATNIYKIFLQPNSLEKNLSGSFLELKIRGLYSIFSTKSLIAN